VRRQVDREPAPQAIPKRPAASLTPLRRDRTKPFSPFSTL
jgi:hypothetical protein